MITVFTPAYNRAHLLPRLFESLRKQTYRDFEWVIVDDGSVDDTRSVVEQFSQNSTLNTNSIRYFYQENGGKHRAINRGVKEAKGELFLILDSDDTLPERSLEWINHYYQQIKDDALFGGVCGYMAHHDGTVIGRLNSSVIDATTLECRYHYKMKGDMCQVYKTEVMRKNPFPEIGGEKFCPEALVLNRIDLSYVLRIFPQVIYYRDYLAGGLTEKIIKIRMESPIASIMTYQEMFLMPIPFYAKIRAAINYWRFRFCIPPNYSRKDIPKLMLLGNLLLPLGWILHKKDLILLKGKNG